MGVTGGRVIGIGGSLKVHYEFSRISFGAKALVVLVFGKIELKR